MSRLRVGINLLWLLPGPAVRGAERYAVRLIRALADEAGEEIEITLYCNRRFPAAYPDLTTSIPTAVAPLDGTSRGARIVVESTWLARETARRDAQLVHHFNDVIPWFRSRPSALTIHDLRSMVGTQVLGRSRAAYFRARVPSSVRHASVVMTPSEFVRGEVIGVLGAAPGRVVVVPAPVSPSTPESVDPSDALVDGRYVVYPATTDRHKNHGVLLEAFAALAAQDADVRLVFTAGPGNAETDVEATIRRLDLGARVVRLGAIPDGDLDRLLHGAVALVYPSRYEGYGLPLAEAMALGCPVIVSAATALPEVAGEAGLVVGPDDVAGWTHAMSRMIHDTALRSRSIAAGRERVASMSPSDSARRLVSAYRIALGAA